MSSNNNQDKNHNQSEIEKENKELRKEVENLNIQLRQALANNQELVSSIEKHTKGINIAGYQHARYYATIKGLVEFVKSMNMLLNNIQITQAELQAQIIGVLKMTQPYFNQEIEQIVEQVVHAQNIQSQKQMDHTNTNKI